MSKKKSSHSLPIPVVFPTDYASSSLDAYIRFVNEIPLLSHEDEYALAEKWRTHEDVEAARYLVLSHLRLVVSIARSYLGYGLPLADVIQEGTIGLMKAVQRFDARKNVRLVTFATHWIRAEINEYVIKNWRIIRTVTTKSQRKLFFNLRKMREDTGNLSQKEAARLAEALNVSSDEIIDMNMRLSGADVNLLGNSDNEDGFAPIDWLNDREHEPDSILARKLQDQLHTDGIQSALDRLDARSRDIIVSRWLVDKEQQQTLQSLAARYKVSAERIRQIEVGAMEKMKQYLHEYQ